MNAEIKERIEMIYRGEVPEGYKKTKVGIIPEDWEVKRLGELGKFFRGKGIPKAKILTEGIGCITYGEIYTTYDYTFDSFKSFIDEKTAKNSVLIKKNDILFAGSGETLEEIGKCVAYLGEGEAYAGGDIVVFRPYNIDGEVLGYLLNHDPVNNQKYKLGQGHSVVHIYARDLETIVIPVLREREQQRIGQILSTWDEAIELKEKLIEEKKEQKKGLMQRLLTGEVRLPGFDGEWEEVKIRNVGVLKSGSGFPEKYQGKTHGEYPFFKVSDMNLKDNVKYMVTANNYIDESAKSDINANVIPKNSIVFAKVGAALLLERKRILVVDSCIDNNMMALIVDYAKDDYLFVYYSLLNTKLSNFSNTGALPSLNARDVYAINLKMPKLLREQKAIAQILSTADKEIGLLEDELELLRLQKKGLMQLLLTGIIRVKC